MVSSFQGYRLYGGIENPGLNGASANLSIFAAASYMMTDRLVFHGSGAKQLLSAPAHPLNQQWADQFTLGASYRLGRNVTLGASVRVTNGWDVYHMPFGTTPLGGPMTSPFGW